MIEVEITEDIRKYKKKSFFGLLTIRQGIGGIFALGFGSFIKFKMDLNTDIETFVLILCCGIPILFGFVTLYNLPFEKFIANFIFSYVLPPKVRRYKTPKIQLENVKDANLENSELSEKKVEVMTAKEKKRYMKTLYKKRTDDPMMQAYR